MKQGIHPDNYRVVVFKDMSDGTQFFGTAETIVWGFVSTSIRNIIV